MRASSLTNLYFESIRTSKAPIAWLLVAIAVHLGLFLSPVGHWLQSRPQIVFHLGDAGVEVELISGESVSPLAQPSREIAQDSEKLPLSALENTSPVAEPDSAPSTSTIANNSRRKSTTPPRAPAHSDRISVGNPSAGSAVAQPAAEIFTPQPPYPPIARELGLEGNVRLRVRVGTDGCARAVEIARSSGRYDFNSSSISTVKRDWRFRPARTVSGAPVESIILVAIRFTLKSG